MADYGDGPQRAYAQAREMVRGRQVFLFLAPFSAGWEADLARLANEERMPVVGPITIFPEDTRASNLFVFHLLSGVSELAEVLALHAEQALALKDRPTVLLYGAGASGKALAEGLALRLGERGWASVSTHSLPAEAAEAGAAVRQMRDMAAASVFVLATGLDISRLAQQAQAVGWLPTLLVPGPLAPRDIVDLPPAFKGKIFLSYSTLPADQKPEAMGDYGALMRSRPPTRAHQTLQLPAYAAALVTADVLKLAGRDIDRSKFVASFASLRGYDAGVIPPLTYNGDRRIGALGGHVVAIDPEGGDFRPLGGFVGLE